MIAVYVLILCLSTLLAARAGMGLWQRLAPLLGKHTTHVGLSATVPALAFLIVVGAPPSVLSVTVAMIAYGTLAPRHLERPLARILFAVTVVLLPMLYLHRPDIVPWLIALAFVWWSGVIATAPRMPSAVSPFALGVIFTCLPLAATPLLVPKASSIAVDAAILASAWLGVLLSAQPHHTVGRTAQWATSMIIGYLQIAALWHGAWPTALASALVWVACMAYVTFDIMARQRARLAEILPHA